MTATDPLDKPATRAALEALREAGLLSARARREALRMVRPPLQWWAWADRILLFLGAALVLAGIVFFFAWNWEAMGRWLKFGLIELGLVASLAAAWRVGLERLVGKVLLLAAAVLVGVFLAVHGQVYQTGADAFELFGGWALLILGWVAIARFAGLWILWLAVVNAGTFLWWDQVMVQAGHEFPVAPFVILALVAGAALVAREVGDRAGWPWLAGKWHRWLLLATLLAWLVLPVVELILQFKDVGAWNWAAAGLWLAAMGGTWWWYHEKVQDLPALTLWAASASAVILALLGRGLWEVCEEAAFFLIFGFLVLGVVSLAVFWLRKTERSFEEALHDG